MEFYNSLKSWEHSSLPLEDAKGNNALWFAVYLVSTSPDITSEIGKYFAACGCDLDKPFKAGFSWNTIMRVITIIEHHEQEE